MTFSHQRFFCLFGVLAAGCALPKMNSDYEGTAGAPSGDAGGARQSGGAANAGASNPGGSSNGGMGQAGRGNGGANVAGNVAMGGAALLGGAAGTTVAAAGTLAAAGGSSNGGNSNLGGANTAGQSSPGGSRATGGNIGTAGVTSIGGASGSNVGGIAGKASTGGANAGGTTSTATAGAATGGVSVAGSGNGGAATGGTATGGTGVGGASGAAGSSSKPTAVSISAGYYHTCAVMSDGTVRCWGLKCDGTTTGSGSVYDCPYPKLVVATPTPVPGLSQVTAVTTGGFHSCALSSDKKVRCWGHNGNGQLGNGTTTASPSPVEVTGITNAKAVVAGYKHSCALLESGQVQCWGQNLSSAGQLGDGTGTQSPVPVSVLIDTNSPPTLLTGVEQIASTDSHTCALRNNGDLYCWGKNDWRACGVENGYNYALIALKATTYHASVGTAKALSIGAGGSYSCALLDDGSVRCWGYPWGGNLGNGTDIYEDDNPKLTYPPSASGPLALSVGYGHSCVIMPNTSHNAQCWGYKGGIGDGTDNNALSPVDVKQGPIANALNLVQIQSISAGNEHTCAIVAGGAVYCWGYGSMGQLGAGNTNNALTAQLVPGL